MKTLHQMVFEPTGNLSQFSSKSNKFLAAVEQTRSLGFFTVHHILLIIGGCENIEQ
jgi:hypothetical protein